MASEVVEGYIQLGGFRVNGDGFECSMKHTFQLLRCGVLQNQVEAIQAVGYPVGIELRQLANDGCGKIGIITQRAKLLRHEPLHLVGSSPGDEEGLKVRKLLAEVNEREFRLSVRKGEYIRKDMVREAWLSRCGRVVNQLRAKFEKRDAAATGGAGCTEYTGSPIGCD